MRNITYENVSENPGTAARTVRFTVTDGDGGLATQSATVDVANVDPTITTFTVPATGAEGTAVALAAAAWLTLVRGPTVEGETAATTADATAAPAAAEGTSRQAVAVLPFADLAGTEDSRAFALGLHDDLMTQLTQVPDLKVTSRTSVMAYADQSRPVEEI